MAFCLASTLTGCGYACRPQFNYLSPVPGVVLHSDTRPPEMRIRLPKRIPGRRCFRQVFDSGTRIEFEEGGAGRAFPRLIVTGSRPGEHYALALSIPYHRRIETQKRARTWNIMRRDFVGGANFRISVLDTLTTRV